MTTARLILLLLLILVAVVLVVVLLRRGSAQRDAQRVEAADLRTRADGLATTMSGQTAFADQAAERAEVARVEAERQVREAQRLEAQAAEQRAAVEATQRDYETTMRRADDIDPDVKESSFPPVDPAAGTDSAEAETQPTRAELRRVREAEQAGEAERAENAGASAEPGPPVPAVGSAALGASTRETRDDDDTSHESERIASAADFRDDVSVDPAPEPAPERTEALPPSGAGGEPGMDEHPSTGTEDRSERADDLSHDAESPQGEWGGPPQDTSPDDIAGPDPVDDPGAATDEPDAATDEPAPGHAPAEAGAAVAETAVIDRSAAELAEEPAEERYDPTPTRDWAADEGELLEETHERGERLAAERAELAQQAHDGTGDASASGGTGDGTASGDASERTVPVGRRISAFDELRDGGFGVGSAAPLHDGAQPLNHPVQADLDSRTFRAPGDPGYDSGEPDVWFYDEGAAERSGFRRADG